MHRKPPASPPEALSEAPTAESTSASRPSASTPEVEVASSLARMQHPIFKKLARKLEDSVPMPTNFGRFRG